MLNSFKILNLQSKVKFQHPKEVMDEISSVSSFSGENSQPSISPLRTEHQINTQKLTDISKKALKDIMKKPQSCEKKSLFGLSMGAISYDIQIPNEMKRNKSVKLIIPKRKSGTRITTKVELLNRVKQLKNSDRFKRQHS